MYKGILLFILFLLSCLVNAQDATEIIRKADEKARGKTSIASITIQIIRPNWTREMKVKGWTKSNDLSIILVTEPVKDKGVVYLKRKKEVWNWIPSIERNIKLPPSMMSQSWMGTDFTNDDLVKEASIVEDYNHSIIGDTVIDQRPCYKIRLLPSRMEMIPADKKNNKTVLIYNSLQFDKPIEDNFFTPQNMSKVK